MNDKKKKIIILLSILNIPFSIFLSVIIHTKLSNIPLSEIVFNNQLLLLFSLVYLLVEVAIIMLFGYGSKSVFQTAYKLYQHSLTCMSGFVQKAAVAAFECADETERMRRAYEIRRGRFIDVLNSIPGVYCALPEGAFYAWVKFDLRGYSSEAVFEYLLNNARVVGMPGIAYGETDISAMRFSFANSDADIETAAGRIKETLFKLTV